MTLYTTTSCKMKTKVRARLGSSSSSIEFWYASGLSLHNADYKVSISIFYKIKIYSELCDLSPWYLLNQMLYSPLSSFIIDAPLFGFIFKKINYKSNSLILYLLPSSSFHLLFSSLLWINI